MFKPALWDAATGAPAIPNGTLGHRFGDEGLGKWNLDLGDLRPELTLLGEEAVEVELPLFDSPDGRPTTVRRGVPVRRVGDRLVTTVFDLMLAQYGVGAPRPAGPLAGRLRRRDGRLHPGLAGDDHQRPGRPGGARRARVRAERRGHPGPLDDPDGRGHQPLVPLRPDLPHDAHADDHHRLPGPQRWRLGALRRPGEGPPDHRLGPDGVRAGLEPSAAPDDPDRLLVHQHRPVALRHLHRRRAGCRRRRQRPVQGQGHRRPVRAVGALGLDAVLPDVRPQPARPSATTSRRPARRSAPTWSMR